MILLILALLAGVLTVLAPCTISLLPVIVGGTISGESTFKRAVTVTMSLGISVILFTLILKVSSAFIQVPQSFWQIFSGVIIVAIGLTMVFPALWERISFLNILNRDSNKVMSKGFMKQSFIGDIIVGASLGPVFTSCSPTYFFIIATVLPKSLSAGLIYLFAYAIGLTGALLVIAVVGQRIMGALGVASDPNGWLKRTIGALFIVVGLFIGSGYDAKLELSLANTGFFNVGAIEQKFLANGAVTGERSFSPGNAYLTTPLVGAQETTEEGRIAAKSARYIPAPEFVTPDGYLNTSEGKPITLAGLKGQVVLIDVWDYSCINCQREIPYVNAWYQKYQNSGLTIVGVHTPEFAFEKLSSNVAAAAKKLGIHYPIILDNEYQTWNAYHNQFWPQVYIIDSDGFVVYSHSGEGDYAETETAIQKALAERATIQHDSTTIPTGTVTPGATEVDGAKLGSPETYFGYNRNEYLANGPAFSSATRAFTIPENLQANGLYLGGTWSFAKDYAETSASAKGTIAHYFTARDVYLVATSPAGAVLRVTVDGKPVGTNAGEDVSSAGTVQISSDRLYHLVHLSEYGTHTIHIEVESGTLDAYTFTFG
ncbi:MAG: redoxin domain-containing protein [Candidatus Paceibacterota bacterium]